MTGRNRDKFIDLMFAQIIPKELEGKREGSDGIYIPKGIDMDAYET